jgi:hypothetical protein
MEAGVEPLIWDKSYKLMTLIMEKGSYRREIIETSDVDYGGRNSNIGEIIELNDVDNGEGRNSSEVREIRKIDNKGVMVKKLFKDMDVLIWKKQITIRSMVTSIV